MTFKKFNENSQVAKFQLCNIFVTIILNYVGDIIQLGDKVTFRFNHLSTQHQVNFPYLYVLDLCYNTIPIRNSVHVTCMLLDITCMFA